ncbi:hypothetical protein [Arsenicibacter rosenii]|uniref:Uncharacterized protein n=1 Tax=Arsenicibacter rosenii TaxID=1750698 RepID=A0A1S2VNJ5_9BACT|nr:hypothetical protein [Arsenicibacter rosenii]OIN59970.1 hypothetical protein BLX24_09035 [Arsenicibacter rosenii]
MRTTTTDFIRLSFHDKKGHGKFKVFTFEDNGFQIAYIPTLDLSSYGDTPKEAIDSLLRVVMGEYFEQLIAAGPTEAYNELKKYGWAKDRIFPKKYKSTAHVDKYGVLRNFSLAEDTKIHEEFVEV